MLLSGQGGTSVTGYRQGGTTKSRFPDPLSEYDGSQTVGFTNFNNPLELPSSQPTDRPLEKSETEIKDSKEKWSRDPGV